MRRFAVLVVVLMLGDERSANNECIYDEYFLWRCLGSTEWL